MRSPSLHRSGSPGDDPDAPDCWAGRVAVQAAPSTASTRSSPMRAARDQHVGRRGGTVQRGRRGNEGDRRKRTAGQGTACRPQGSERIDSGSIGGLGVEFLLAPAAPGRPVRGNPQTHEGLRAKPGGLGHNARCHLEGQPRAGAVSGRSAVQERLTLPARKDGDSTLHRPEPTTSNASG